MLEVNKSNFHTKHLFVFTEDFILDNKDDNIVNKNC